MSLNQKYFNFNKVAEFDIGELKKFIPQLTSPEWRPKEEDNRYSPAFEDTQSYFIYKTDVNWDKQTTFKSEIKTNRKELIDLVDPIIDELNGIHNGQNGQVFLLKVLGNNKLDEHQDLGVYLTSVRRHFIPIEILGDIKFNIGGQHIAMREGSCWEINNNQPHSIDNKSELSSVYLVVDIMPNDEIA